MAGSGYEGAGGVQKRCLGGWKYEEHVGFCADIYKNDVGRTDGAGNASISFSIKNQLHCKVEKLDYNCTD